jgi:hypothetical protein
MEYMAANVLAELSRLEMKKTMKFFNIIIVIFRGR